MNRSTNPSRRRRHRQGKKNGFDELSHAEKRRYEEIVAIQTYLKEGYAAAEIRKLMNTSFTRIRRYATGDPLNMCRFGGNKPSVLDAYRETITGYMMDNLTIKDALERIRALGCEIKRTAFTKYCKKLILERSIDYQPKRNTLGLRTKSEGKTPPFHCLSKKEIINYLWSNRHLNEDDIAFIHSKYPVVSDLDTCIQEFRKIYDEKDLVLLDGFISKYANSNIPNIQSFASGLLTDYEAVKNSVTSELSNGFVEGINNKIKVIKRIMYGRALIPLLRIKIVYSS